MSAPIDDPPIPRNPLRLMVSRQPWAALAYLASYLVVGTVLFVASLTAIAVAGLASVTVVGLPLLVAAAVLLRGCADVERGRLLLLLPSGVPPPYRAIASTGLIAQLKDRWSDPATRRDLAYLIGLYLPLVIADAVVAELWLGFLAGVTSPLWFWSVPQSFPDGSQGHGLNLGYFPHGPHGPGGYGWFIGDLGSAVAFALVCLGLAILTAPLLVRAALAHARMARALLRPSTDPLAPARRILAEPGPLPR